ncbi:MAG: hypothetical protein ACLSEY_14705 [Enterocloster sp.]
MENRKTWNKIIEQKTYEDCESAGTRLRQNRGRALVMALQLLLIMESGEAPPDLITAYEVAHVVEMEKIEEDFTNREYKEN